MRWFYESSLHDLLFCEPKKVFVGHGPPTPCGSGDWSFANCALRVQSSRVHILFSPLRKETIFALKIRFFMSTLRLLWLNKEGGPARPPAAYASSRHAIIARHRVRRVNAVRSWSHTSDRGPKVSQSAWQSLAIRPSGSWGFSWLCTVRHGGFELARARIGAEI